MRLLLKIFRIFFTALGVLFFIILIAGAYLWVADPFEVKPLLKLLIAPPATLLEGGLPTNQIQPDAAAASKTFTLTAEQKTVLSNLGVNINALPTTITPAMENCFIQILGEQRVKEIEQGSSPTTQEFLQASRCLQ